MNDPDRDLAAVIERFLGPGTPVRAERHGAGLINETWLCEQQISGGARRYILQRINGAVFPRPDQVMENLATVTGHVRERLRREGVEDPCQHAPCLVPARDGRAWHRDGAGRVWRLFQHIEGGTVTSAVSGRNQAFQVGRAVGRFQALVADLPASRLHDTLPGFHITPCYLDELRDAARRDAAGRAAGAAAELVFAEERRRLATLLTDPMREGRVPLRVVHNDPKVNNVLLHRETGEAVCMLDLDTVKPGIAAFDFGDCVRSAANPAGEDASRLDEVVFDGACYEAVREGYLAEAAQFLTPAEAALLPASVLVITYELGIRFLADHLRGDAYFRTSAPGHNLLRARVQFRLLERMEQAGLI